MFGGHETADAVLRAGQVVVGLGVEAGIGQQLQDRQAPGQAGQERVPPDR